jgi:hypothetical protein
MKLSTIAVNAAAIEQGRWVSISHVMPDVKLKVRGLENEDYQRLFNKLISAIPRAERLKGPDATAMREMTTKLLAETVLVDWSGIENDDGSPMLYSKAKAQEILSDPNLVVFRKAVEWAAGVVGEDDMAEAEDVTKN